jgi:hypothetical protein
MPNPLDELRESIRLQNNEEVEDPNYLDLTVSVTDERGFRESRRSAPSATEARWEVAFGGRKLVVEPRALLSMDPWIVRLVDSQGAVVEEWTVSSPTRSPIRVPTLAGEPQVTFVVDPVHFSPEAMDQIRGMADWLRKRRDRS